MRIDPRKGQDTDKVLKFVFTNEDELAEIFAMFDRFEPARNVKIPSPDDLTHW